jgi:hypothetical protein
MAPLGSSRLNQWRVSETDVDLVRRRPALRRLRIEATPQAVTLDLECTAILVIDMQNDFCHPDGVVTRTKFGPREDWKSQLRFRLRSQLATSGKRLLGRRGACGGI